MTTYNHVHVQYENNYEPNSGRYKRKKKFASTSVFIDWVLSSNPQTISKSELRSREILFLVAASVPAQTNMRKSRPVTLIITRAAHPCIFPGSLNLAIHVLQQVNYSQLLSAHAEFTHAVFQATMMQICPPMLMAHGDDHSMFVAMRNSKRSPKAFINMLYVNEITPEDSDEGTRLVHFKFNATGRKIEFTCRPSAQAKDLITTLDTLQIVEDLWHHYHLCSTLQYALKYSLMDLHEAYQLSITSISTSQKLELQCKLFKIIEKYPELHLDYVPFTDYAGHIYRGFGDVGGL